MKKIFLAILIALTYASAEVTTTPINLENEVHGEWTAASYEQFNGAVSYYNNFVNYYTFHSSRQRTIKIALKDAEKYSYIYLIDSDNKLIKHAYVNYTANGYLTATIPAGDYTVAVDSEKPADYELLITTIRTPDTYAITLDNPPLEGSWDSNSALSPNGYQSHEGYSNYYTFTLTEKTIVTIDLEADIRYYKFNLLGTNGDQIAWDDGYTSNDYIRKAHILKTLEAGTYIIDVNTNYSKKVGSYTIELGKKRIPDTTEIQLDTGAVSGEWKSTSAVSPQKENSYSNYYTFTLNKKTMLTIDVISEVDNRMYLLDSNDTVIEYDYDSGTNNNAHMLVTLDAGTYTVDAMSVSTYTTGDFTIELSKKRIPTNTIIAVDGGAVDGSWSSHSVTSPQREGVYSHYYTFTLDEESIVAINLDAKISGDHTPNPYMYLLDKNGTTRADDNNNGSGDNAYIMKRLEAGTYTIDATTVYKEVGEFSIEVKTIQEPSDTNIQANGNSTSGSWSNNSGLSYNRQGSYAHYYTFTLSKKTMVKIDLTSNTDSYIYLMADNGYIYKTDNNSGKGNNAMLYKVLDAGTYTVEATTNNPNETGTFKLTVATPTALELAKPVTLNKPEVVVNGKWTNNSPLSLWNSYYKAEYYTFTLTAKTKVEIGLESAGDNYLVLRNANGDIIDRNDDRGEGYDAFMSPTLNAGTYIIEATAYEDPLDIGDFKLKIRDLNFPSPYGWLPAIYHTILN